MRYRLRRIMRGYRYLKRIDSLDLIGNITRDFTRKQLDIKKSQFSKIIFGTGIDHAEIICRQYLLLRCAGLHFNCNLLYGVGKPGRAFISPLPPQWRLICKQHSVNIASVRNAMLWNSFIMMMLAYGIFTIAKIIFAGIKATFMSKNEELERYVYFHALTSGNLPQPCKDGRSYDIITWYSQWNGSVPDINNFCHGVNGVKETNLNGKPVIFINTPVLLPIRFSRIIGFLIWGIGASLLAFLDFMRGRWWHPLLLNQAALAAQVRIMPPNKLAKEYLFHNSGWFFRPLWTYEAEKLGSQITMYFYSTNCEPFKRVEDYPPLPYGWEAMNWPRYLVWDGYQADFVRNAVGKSADICVVGPIWFNSSNTEIPVVTGKKVAVFDITPHRASRYQTLGIDFEYYLPTVCNSFLQDIQKAAENCGYKMLWKRKRKIGNMMNPHYAYLEEQLSNSTYVVSIDPNIAAHRLIEYCDIVISMPFTSTALIARDLGKPSCYYDPTGLVQKDDRAAHGIPIITGMKELACWLKNHE